MRHGTFCQTAHHDAASLVKLGRQTAPSPSAGPAGCAPGTPPPPPAAQGVTTARSRVACAGPSRDVYLAASDRRALHLGGTVLLRCWLRQGGGRRYCTATPCAKGQENTPALACLMSSPPPAAETRTLGPPPRSTAAHHARAAVAHRLFFIYRRRPASASPLLANPIMVSFSCEVRLFTPLAH